MTGPGICSTNRFRHLLLPGFLPIVYVENIGRNKGREADCGGHSRLAFRGMPRDCNTESTRPERVFGGTDRNSCPRASRLRAVMLAIFQLRVMHGLK